MKNTIESLEKTIKNCLARIEWANSYLVEVDLPEEARIHCLQVKDKAIKLLQVSKRKLNKINS